MGGGSKNPVRQGPGTPQSDRFPYWGYDPFSIAILLDYKTEEISSSLPYLPVVER